MAQAALKTDTAAAALHVLQGRAEADAFAAALDAVRDALKARGEASGAFVTATREAGWAMVDCLAKLDASNRSDEAYAMAVELAIARGVKESGHRKYGQRGRNVVTYWSEVLKSDRSKAEPISVADRLAQKAKQSAMAENAIQCAEDDFGQEATSMAAAALNMTLPAFEAARRGAEGDDKLVECVRLRRAAIDTLRQRREVLDKVKAMIAEADNDTIAAIRALVA